MIELSLPIFPTPDIKRTLDFYANILGFRSVSYLSAEEPHVCLYRDKIEIILLKASSLVIPNRKLYGYGYDAYFICHDLDRLQESFSKNGAKIVKPLQSTDYQNKEFVVEDCDARYLAFGIKQKGNIKDD